MQRTIQFTQTSELVWAATAYARRNARVVQAVCVGIAAVGMGASYLAAISGQRLVGWMALSVSLFLLYFVAYTWRMNDRKEFRDRPQRITFTDKGFTHDPEHDFFVSWDNVRYVRKTPRLWAIHFICDGRESFVMIPVDEIDCELRTLIDGYTRTR